MRITSQSYRAAALASIAALLCLAGPAAAQTPFPTVAYIVGRANMLDLASDSEIPGPDGRPDGWVRVLVRALGYNIAEANGKLPKQRDPGNRPGLQTLGPVSGGRSETGGISGYHIRSMTLRHKTIPGLRWDTVPGNGVPLLVVMDAGVRVNAADGSIAGYNLSTDRLLDLYMADPGQIGWRIAGFVLDIDTLDGKLTIDVQPQNIYESTYLY